ncbi:YtxH domain-containing protein [Candidatus Nomurabacteria bacterium]|uniref:YtxH domain-containing protein n=1 Tax=Candidatus Dojkabacteria bacterium TaxID=2099670 RepID=A0A955KWG4_9BACT|nr:YtxH domain-containing protein [Candidatus Dojkabacteria bacterium]MCB9803332.1 YtxH domain-containing protein [Candidatus Nomurabacteria bacterium]
MSKGTSFVKGAVAGAIAGTVAGVLFAPKSGKETRNDIKKKAQELKTQAEDVYKKAKMSLDKKVAEVKKLGTKIDKVKYEELVDGVLAELKNNKEITSEASKKLGVQLKADWNKIKDALQA